MERIKGIVLAVLGIGLCIGATLSGMAVGRFVNDSVVVPGRVVKLNAGGSHPEIMFTTRRGAQVSYPQGGWVAGHVVGDSVRVRYRDGAPATSATLDRFGALFFWPVLLGVIGGGFVILGAVQWRMSRKG